MRSLVSSLIVAACSVASSLAQAPAQIQPPAGQHAVLTVQGRGAQVYNCQQTGTTFQWIFQSPVARLFDTNNMEVGTHGDGPTWTYQDSSSIQGLLLSKVPASAPADIPWLLLKATHPVRNGILTTVEFISRTETKGGSAPAAVCDAIHKGDLVRVPYTATYTFYSSAAPQPTASN